MSFLDIYSIKAISQKFQTGFFDFCEFFFKLSVNWFVTLSTNKQITPQVFYVRPMCVQVYSGECARVANILWSRTQVARKAVPLLNHCATLKVSKTSSLEHGLSPFIYKSLSTNLPPLQKGPL